MIGKPWAFGGRVIADDVDVRARLRGGGGLPWSSARVVERVGSDPRVTAVARRSLGLEVLSQFSSPQVSASYLATVLRALDQPGPQRLVCADVLPPASLPASYGDDGAVVLALGPLDLRTEDGTDWYIRDVLQPERAADLDGSFSVDLGGALDLGSGATLTVACPFTDAGTVAIWWQPDQDETGATRYLFDLGGLALYFLSVGDSIYVYHSGGTDHFAAAWTAGDTLRLAVAWDSGGIVVYLDGVKKLDVEDVAGSLGGTLYLGSDDTALNRADGLVQVLCWNVALSEAELEEVTGWEAWDWAPRWVEAVVEKVDILHADDWDLDAGLQTSLTVDGDRLWRAPGGWYPWTIDADGDQLSVENNGEADARPVLVLSPDSGATSGLAYSRFAAVVWRAAAAGASYPVELTNAFDTAALVTAGKMQSDGDDLRVSVDGAEVDRWIQDINTASTEVWAVLDFEAAQADALASAILSSGEITTISCSGDISGFPLSGILLIGSEVFTYTGRDSEAGEFTGVSRAARGSAMAAHSISDPVYWVQHDISILYGDASAGIPTTDDTTKPAFDLTSSNTSWVYSAFGADNGLRSGQWLRRVLGGVPVFYGGNEGAAADPWAELGVYGVALDMGQLQLYNPCGIVSAAFTNGEKRNQGGSWDARLRSSGAGSVWVTEASIAAPSGSGWETWSATLSSITASTKYLGMLLSAYYATAQQNLEAADCTVGLNTSYTPTVTLAPEQTNYGMDVTITNTTTGEAISLSLVLGLGEVLIIDTDQKTVTLDGVGCLHVLSLSTDRADWLRLVPGTNVLEYGADVTGDVDGWVFFEARLYR